MNKVFVVVDLEWNQPVPWLNNSAKGQKLLGEIIEIGAVKLLIDSDSFSLSQPFRRTVKPCVYTVMNKNVGRVINKCSSDLKNGISFSQAYEDFLRWCDSDSVVLCSWGNSDIDILKANLRFHHLSDRLSMDFLDVQPLFSKRSGHGSEQKSLGYALDFFQIDHDKTFHEAYSDAYNTGMILRELLSDIEAKSLVEVLNDYIYNPDETIQKTEHTKAYRDVSSCFVKNREKIVFCPICSLKLNTILEWFRMKNAAFFLGRCNHHGYISSRMRMKKNIEGQVFASIITKRIYPGEADMIFLRYDKSKSTESKAAKGDF